MGGIKGMVIMATGFEISGGAQDVQVFYFTVLKLI